MKLLSILLLINIAGKIISKKHKILLFSTFNLVISADIDCSIYLNDLDIANLNPFFVRSYFYPGYTSINLDQSQKLTRFSIYNDVNPFIGIYCLKSLQELILVNTNLTILPDIKNLQQLTSLKIQKDNAIIGQHLPSEFGQLTALSNLELNDIQNLEDLPDSIGSLTQIQTLILKQIPNLNGIPATIGKLINLRTLNLIELPSLSNIPDVTTNFQLLHDFEITQTNINTLALDQLKSLNSLKITYNPSLESINISNMVKLYSLDIENNGELSTLNLENFPQLQSLTIAANGKLNSLNIDKLSLMSSISITDSAQLKTITVKNSVSLSIFMLSTLPNVESVSFEDLPNLSSISIKNSPRLKSISFKNVPSLLSIDLSGCQLTEFPQSILALKQLHTLVLTSNQLSSLPSSIANDLPNLKVLNLENNQLQGNFFQIGLTGLGDLYLTNNSLTSIEDIDKYVSLQNLALGYNQISTIPITIMKLSSTLKTLAIDSNKLTTVPYEMSNLRSLTSLSAMSNNMSAAERTYLFKLFQQAPISARF